MRKNCKNLLLSVLLCGIITPAISQPLPIDPNVRYGKLSNGLTYYVRHNELPKNSVDFYIAQNVGSILEEENQRGLAHFLEHMAFNGTKNFPEKEMLNYLEKNGVKFGTNVNAYTSFDETVYNISNVPTQNPALVDSCLLAIYDWSAAISLEDKEIDSERGVIREEWRTRSNAGMRIIENQIQDLFPNSRYANRMPIGLIDVINNFSYKELRDYYHKWYRPDLQGIIVVGDIDAEAMEAQIKKMFGAVKLPENLAVRTQFNVPNNQEPIISIQTDKEATSSRVQIFFKHKPLSDSLLASVDGMKDSYIQSIISTMLNARLQEMLQKGNAPFLNTGTYDGKYFVARTMNAFTAVAIAKEGGTAIAFEALLREILRADRHGFTTSEFGRARADFMSQLESFYKEKDTRKNDSYGREYVSHFTDGGSIPGADINYYINKELAKQISLDEINDYFKNQITNENVAISIDGIAKEGVSYPTSEEVLEIYNNTIREEIAPYQDNVSTEPLIKKLPKKGKITKTIENKEMGTITWILSNGAKVVIKPTDFKADEIVMNTVSPGGNALLPDKELYNFKFINDLIEIGGLGEFSAVELSKKMAGINVEVSASINATSETISAHSTPKDLETMMQLVYLQFTAPRKDLEAYGAWFSRIKSMLEAQEANPMLAMQDSITSTVYNNTPRKMVVKADFLDKIEYDKVFKIYKKRFENAGDFSFTFVGNIDLEQFKPLVEQYIASLPANKKREKLVALPQLKIAAGVKENNFEKPMETLKSTVRVYFSGDIKYSLDNAIKATMLEQILDIVFTKTIREEEGGTYGVGTYMQLSPVNNEAILLIAFDTAPELRAKLTKRAIAEMNNIVKNGIDPLMFNKVKEYLLKKAKEDIKENNYWLGELDFQNLFAIDRITDYSKTVEAQTPEMIAQFLDMLLKQGNRIEISQSGIK